MHSTSSIGRMPTLALLSVVTMPLDTAQATPRCTGPFKGTCLRPLLRHFDAAGTCAADQGPVSESGAQTLTLCWRNGATVVGTFDPASQSWAVVHRSSHGKVVARSTTVVSPTGVESTFNRRGRRWIVRRPVPDPFGFDVTCPNGRTETYSAGLILNTPSQPRCIGGIVGCPPGPCP
jgi:hypothetical protein